MYKRNKTIPSITHCTAEYRHSTIKSVVGKIAKHTAKTAAAARDALESGYQLKKSTE